MENDKSKIGSDMFPDVVQESFGYLNSGDFKKSSSMAKKLLCVALDLEPDCFSDFGKIYIKILYGDNFELLSMPDEVVSGFYILGMGELNVGCVNDAILYFSLAYNIASCRAAVFESPGVQSESLMWSAKLHEGLAFKKQGNLGRMSQIKAMIIRESLLVSLFHLEDSSLELISQRAKEEM